MMLHEFHQSLGAHFARLNGAEVAADYGDAAAEYAALRHAAAVLDLGFRGRICLLGADRVRFLHGQVTNDVKHLQPGQGCYAALVTAKGRMESDLNIFCLEDELLLDFEPGLTEKITRRLEQFIVADDVQLVDVSALHGLLSVQGPQAHAVVGALGIFPRLPGKPFESLKISDATLGEIYLACHPRIASAGFDVFAPANSLGAVADKLIAAAKARAGGPCGWTAFETARIEEGIPRYSADMDETTLPLECGIEARAVSYNKGCYIGQEVINRIHSIGHVNRELRGLRLADGATLPARGDTLFFGGKEVGRITSAVHSPALQSGIALGYVRREANAIGTELTVRTGEGEITATIAALPFGHQPAPV